MINNIIRATLVALISFSSLLAQEQDYAELFSNLENEIPNDPNVRIGVLENGMTYYVRKNSKPENQNTIT